MAAAASTEGLVRVSWCSVVVLRPASFVLEGGPVGVFKGRDSMFDGDTISIMVFS